MLKPIKVNLVNRGPLNEVVYMLNVYYAKYYKPQVVRTK